MISKSVTILDYWSRLAILARRLASLFKRKKMLINKDKQTHLVAKEKKKQVYVKVHCAEGPTTGV